MFNSLKTSDLNSGSIRVLSSQRSTLFTNLDRSNSSQGSVSFQARSSQNIGTFDRAFSINGTLSRNQARNFRFSVDERTRVRIYLGNQLGGAATNDRRMFVDLFNTGTGSKVKGLNVNSGRINAVTAGLAPGNYRLRVSTPSKQRGSFFLDVIGGVR